MIEGVYTKKLKADRAICSLCYHQCLISPDCKGICKVRENKKGKIYALNYQKVADEAVLPISHVLLTHVLPGTKTHVITFEGNNFRAEDEKIEAKKMTPDQIVKKTIKEKCPSVTFAGNEPTMAFESIVEIAKKAKSSKIKTILVTNGYFQEKALKELIKVINAFRINLFTINKDLFFEKTGAKLYPVQKTIEELKKANSWIEIVTELNSFNDSEGEIKTFAEYILTLKVPWHITGYVNEEKKVFIKNLVNELKMQNVYFDGDSLSCPKCQKKLQTDEGIKLVKNTCSYCKAKVEGIF